MTSSDLDLQKCFPIGRIEDISVGDDRVEALFIECFFLIDSNCFVPFSCVFFFHERRKSLASNRMESQLGASIERIAVELHGNGRKTTINL